jgi:ATP-dependent HslUV protease ATP-binding subunit HslU
VGLSFTEAGVDKLAEIAFTINNSVENIGARRLHTVLERLLEEISFNASEQGGSTLAIDADYVEQKLEGLSKNTDLSKFIL